MVALGIVTIIMGSAAILFPLFGSIAVAVVIGFALVIAGIAQIIAAFSHPKWGVRILTFIVGLLSLLAGIFLLLNPVNGIFALTIVVAAIFFTEGIWKTIYAFRMRPHPGWGWLLFDGILSVVLGLMLWVQFPSSALWALGILAGISILLSGWTMVMLGVAIGKITDQG
tara:strand:+ start:4410 stop:4916 length:507 start_codon:yes stop_codon:yes gene_type:complete